VHFRRSARCSPFRRWAVCRCAGPSRWMIRTAAPSARWHCWRCWRWRVSTALDGRDARTAVALFADAPPLGD